MKSLQIAFINPVCDFYHLENIQSDDAMIA